MERFCRKKMLMKVSLFAAALFFIILKTDLLWFLMKVTVRYTPLYDKGRETAQRHRSPVFRPPTMAAFHDVREETNDSGLGWKHDSDVINQLVVTGQLDFDRVARYPVEDKWLTPMEREILKDEPLTDLSTVATPKTSQLQVVGLGPGRTTKVGHPVMARVDLKDQKGRAVLKGGHEVRIWMVGSKNHVRAAVDVTDLRNGTYVALLPVLWTGNMEVRAAVVRPREFRRTWLTLLDKMKMTNQIQAIFVSGRRKQVTLCSFIPVIPGFRDVCNLTSDNHGLPWFCGRPTAPGLECKHWTLSARTEFPQTYPVSDAENALIRRFASVKHSINQLRQKVSFQAIQDNSTRTAAATTCPVQARDTWTDQSPRGYWQGEQWVALHGCSMPALDPKQTWGCLRDTHVITMGDSNARVIAWKLSSTAECKSSPNPLASNHTTNLHFPLRFHCAKQNLTLSWYPHAFPFTSGTNSWSDNRVKYPPSFILDTVPATGRHVILLHLYAHFSHVHTFAYAAQVKDTVEAVSRLLQRNPDVQVIVRGPHAFGGNMVLLPGDFHAERCLRVLREEFRALRERVVLLNPWHMTVANENLDVHPADYVVSVLCRMVLAYVCAPPA